MSAPVISVLGAGGWGTALAILFADRGLPVTLWGYDPAHVERLCSARTNEKYLPGVPWPDLIHPTHRLEDCARADIVLFVTPSKAIRATAARFAALDIPPESALICCTKGIEHGSGLRMSEILREHFPAQPLAALSGPSHAEEVARRMPAAVALGCVDPAAGARLQHLLSTPYFRTYTTRDIAGVELGGALKNIFAIAAGLSDGLGFGDNSKAALVTRSLVELVRLGEAMGGRRETFWGLSGIGDLMVTCFSRHSRNRAVGERLGRGETLEAVLGGLSGIAEGVPTARSAFECARRHGHEAVHRRQQQPSPRHRHPHSSRTGGAIIEP